MLKAEYPIYQDYALNTDIIQIWHGNIAAEEADYQAYWRILDAAEQARAGKFKNELLRNRYVEVHGRLRKLLAQILNEAPEKICIKIAEHGKPYLADTPELGFNLSHSANAMAVAVGWNCRVGVDVEHCKPRSGLAGLVDKCFAKEEIAYWNRLSETQKVLEFYRFWTRKEALVKATGGGIALGLNQCVINPENQTGFLKVPDNCGQASTWHALDIAVGEDVCSALVTDKYFDSVRLIDFSK